LSELAEDVDLVAARQACNRSFVHGLRPELIDVATRAKFKIETPLRRIDGEEFKALLKGFRFLNSPRR
jgi:hypothetical protein